ncbi:MAG: hypothetical protein GY810_01135 [Aureispira sp.]|nr:hypothetical protein [Aureispira sp.]
MNEREMFERSFMRPANYFLLPEKEQWGIDEKLGILDWKGDSLTELDLGRMRKYYNVY